LFGLPVKCDDNVMQIGSGNSVASWVGLTCGTSSTVLVATRADATASDAAALRALVCHS
jgi:hypothetical protein